MESNVFKRPRLGPRHRFWRRFLRLCFVVGPGSYVGEPKSPGFIFELFKAFWGFLGPFREKPGWKMAPAGTELDSAERLTGTANSDLDFPWGLMTQKASESNFLGTDDNFFFLGEFMESNFFRRLRLGPHHHFWRRF